eukprot:TRINITY_DN135349_c2_g1_i1.p1 TRINITY_DN135349_c2_g1~~TRINITY_DN135349_c2_g1_i1.p1  ORF type:complete len:1128 (-),score=119.65 TRINITY_DN135349_c2_g1_i1:2063-5362(-)
MNMKNAFTNHVVPSNPSSKHKRVSSLVQFILGEYSLHAPSKDNDLVSPSAVQKPSQGNIQEKSKRILDRLIPLLRYLKADSSKAKKQGKPGSHKKSFSVSQQKFKEYYAHPIAEHPKELPLQGKKKKSVAEYPTLDELLSQKGTHFNYLSVGQSLAWSSQDEDSVTGKPLNNKVVHNRTKSSHTKVSNMSKDSIQKTKAVSTKSAKPAINIEEQYRAQAKLLQQPQADTRKKQSEGMRKKSAVTTPSSPLRQYKAEVKKPKGAQVNHTHYESNLSKTKLGHKKPSVNETVQKIMAWHKRSASDGVRAFINLGEKRKAGESTERSKAEEVKDQGKKQQSTERSNTNNSQYKELKKVEPSGGKRSISSAGYFDLAAKRPSVPMDAKKLAQGHYKDASVLARKAKINTLIHSINLGKPQAPSNTFIEQSEPSVVSTQKKADAAKIVIKSPSPPPHENKENGFKKSSIIASKYHLYENLSKYKKEPQSTSPPPQNVKGLHKFHKHMPSFSIPKAGPPVPKTTSGKFLEGKLSVSKVGPATAAVTPYVSTKKVLCSVPVSKGPSAAHSPEPVERSGEKFGEEKFKVNPAKPLLIKKYKKPQEVVPQPKVVPLSKENIEKLQRIKDGEALAEYIRKYFKEHNEAPKTGTEFYRVGRLLGKGAFGKVNLGMHKLTGKLVAIKSINKEYLTDESSKKKVMQEFSILKLLRHPNVIRLYESFESAKHILIVMELCTGGDLLNYVRKRRKLKEDMAKFVFKRLIEGLYHCHCRGVLHRDIKLDNVLLNGSGELKICDFGVSKIVRKGERMTEQCGTPAYIAPEILRDRGYEGFAVDIWSAGVALYAMLYGTVPFKANNMKELHKLIMKGKYTLKEEVSKEARDLLTRLLECDPYKRINIPEILAHEWMQGIADSISLFTEQERELLGKEYCYSDKAKRKDGGETNTLFTEQNIDSTQNELTKNNTTKSVILAPFNSTRTDQNTSKDYIARGCAMKDKREIIKFAAKVRDIDRQYEKNNNGDVDNGVYNKFVCDSSDENNNNEISSSEDGSISVDGRLFDGKASPMGNINARMDQFREKKSIESTLPFTTAQSVIIGKLYGQLFKQTRMR